MPFDMNNDYTSAGPGHKRRRARLTIETVKRHVAKPKPYQAQTPTNQNAAKEENTIKLTAMGVKHRITLLTLQHEHYFDICDRLNKEGFGDLTKVLISHHRDMVRQVLRVLIDENLITQKALDRYRAQTQADYRSRFKRKREVG